MVPLVFILGAQDPEMDCVEQGLRALGLEVAHATTHVFGVGHQRVTAAQAYGGARVAGYHYHRHLMILVECADVYAAHSDPEVAPGALRSTEAHPHILVDHHHPGDPGYGVVAASAVEAADLSSLGQLARLLSRLVAGGFIPQPLSGVYGPFEVRVDGHVHLTAAGMVVGALDHSPVVACADPSFGAACRAEMARREGVTEQQLRAAQAALAEAPGRFHGAVDLTHLAPPAEAGGRDAGAIPGLRVALMDAGTYPGGAVALVRRAARDGGGLKVVVMGRGGDAAEAILAGELPPGLKPDGDAYGVPARGFAGRPVR